MSARPRQQGLNYHPSAPLPTVVCPNTGMTLGVALPMHPSQPVYSHPEIEARHAMRATLVRNARAAVQVSVTKTPKAIAAIATTDACCDSQFKNDGRVLPHLDAGISEPMGGPDTPDGRELEKALCAAAHSGSIDIMQPLINAGVHKTVFQAPALAAAALGRQAEAGRMLLRAGASKKDATLFLQAKREDDAAAWLGRLVA